MNEPLSATAVPEVLAAPVVPAAPALIVLLEEVRRQGTRIDRLEMAFKRIEEHQNKHSEIGSTVDEHGETLEEHARKLISIETSVRSIRTDLHTMAANVGRISDGLSTSNLGFERMEQLLSSDRTERMNRDTSMQRTLDRVVEFLQPKAAL